MDRVVFRLARGKAAQVSEHERHDRPGLEVHRKVPTRGLRQGLVQADGTPRERIVVVYREAFGEVLKAMNGLAP